MDLYDFDDILRKALDIGLRDFKKRNMKNYKDVDMEFNEWMEIIEPKIDELIASLGEQ